MAKIILGKDDNKELKYELNDLTKHAAILGTTGSGKTVMCKVIVEEALLKGIPVIAIDPKGDISSLGIFNKNYDFRPHLPKSKAETISQKYLKNHNTESPLFKHNTKIFTPKSKAGIQVSLMPDLTCPKNFSKIKNYDASTISALVDPISDSLVSLAGIKSNKDKVQTIISQIILDSWSNEKDLDLDSLIKKLITPDFEEVGSLSLEDFLKEKDRLKAASSLNLLLSSPSKKVWSEGTPLDSKEMLKANNLNVFDLRFCHSQQEKQFVVEQVLQNLYKFLLQKGGSTNLRYILYVDELAGLLPPPPSNPMSKKLLEVLIRQGRAFGLGIIVATQNPGDVDYKLFGNIGSRFIGKLRTDNDVEKVASATDNKPSELKSVLAKAKIGDFFLNNAVRNKNHFFKTRWVFTYHEGPLTDKQISWINNVELKPRVEGKLKASVKKKISPEKKNIDDYSVIRRGRIAQRDKKIISNVSLQKNRKNLSELIKNIKKEADSVNIKVALGKFQTTIFTPHLRLVVEPKPYKNNNLKIQGPFLFDLTSKAIPLGDYLSKRTWSQFVPEDVNIEKPVGSLKPFFNHALKESKSNLKTTFYESKFANIASSDPDSLVEANVKHLKKLATPRVELLRKKLDKSLKELSEKRTVNNKKIKQLKIKSAKKTASRAVTKLFSKKKLLDETSEMKHWNKRVRELKREVSRIDKQIDKKKKDFEKSMTKIDNTIFDKARTQVKTKVYMPKSKDLVIKATILLLPKKINKK